jgi:transcriptional repressor NrdR
LIKASQKRPISLQVIDNAVLKILSYLESLEYHEIPTKLIGDELMKQLRNIDPIAYVRYASVYRAFQEVGEFIEEIQSLNDQSKNITIS